MNRSRRKIAARIIPVLMLGMISLLSGCSMSAGVPKINTTRDGMLRGTLKLSPETSAVNGILVEKIMPSKVTVGKPFDYVLSVTNQTGCSFSDVVVSERFPEKYEMSKASPDPTKVTGRTAEWIVGELGPKEVKTFKIRGTAQETSSMRTCAKVTYVPMLCLGPETTVSGLKLTMEAPDQTLLCDGITEKIKIENTGTDLMEDIKIAQSLPEGLTTIEGKRSLEIGAGKLAGNETKKFDVKLKAQKAGSYTLTVKAVASNGLSASSVSVTTAVKQPVLKISVVGPEKVFVTRDADFKITVENAGSADSAKTEIVAKIPAGMKFVSASNGGSLAGESVVWSLGTLSSQKAVSLNATFKSVSNGSFQMVSMAHGVCCQEVSTAAKIDVLGIPAILLEAIDTEDPIQVGGVEKFRVVVTNQGSAADAHIVLRVDFEKNFDYVSSVGPTQAKAESVKTIEFAPLATLAPGQKATWEILAKATEEGDHRASFHVKSDALGRSVEKVESTRVY